jgi:N-acetylmuramic acid 6-phosphate etherase
VLAAATEAAAMLLEQGGRLVYAGAGTSGRIAVQDGAELAPTFNWPRDRVVFALAGGMGALTISVEGAEDDAANGARLMDEAAVSPADVVICVAASGTTPFTLGALCQANELGALTIGLASNPDTPMMVAARFAVLLETGAEPVAGSTRMKAGTAQKAALNLLSTGIMLRLGRVYRGMMVNMRPANAKLRRRAEEMVARISGIALDEAAAALALAEGDIKVAALLALGSDRAEAAAILAKAGGNLRRALALFSSGEI